MMFNEKLALQVFIESGALDKNGFIESGFLFHRLKKSLMAFDKTIISAPNIVQYLNAAHDRSPSGKHSLFAKWKELHDTDYKRVLELMTFMSK